MAQIEKIYNRVLGMGKLELTTIVVTGKKNSSEMRVDGMYYHDFKSEKYSNVANLAQLDIKNDAYLGLVYKGYNEDNVFESEEVWMNSKGIDNFRDFLMAAYEDITTNADAIYGKNSITPEYEDWTMETGYDEDGNGFGNVDNLGHTIFIYPQVCFVDENTPYNGVVLGIVNEDGGQVGQELGLTTLYNLLMTVKNYDLLAENRAATITGLLYQLLNSSSSSSGSSGTVKKSFKPLKSRATTEIKKPIQRRPLLSDELKKHHEEEDVEEEDTTVEEVEVEEAPAPKKSFKKASKAAASAAPAKTVKKKTVVAKETNKIALNDILNEADDIEIDLSDEEGEY